MKSLILLFLVLSGIEHLYSQVFEQWVARYNGTGNGSDWANSIAVDNLGNVYVTGFSFGNGTSNDYATIKYDPTGAQLWVKTYNGLGNNDDQAIALGLDNESNVYIAGSSRNSDGNYDFVTLKYDTYGNVKWIQIYNGTGNVDDVIHAMAVDDSGNVFVTGEATIEGQIAAVTIKYSSVGSKLWEAVCSGQAGDIYQPNALALDKFGNIYITGKGLNGANFDILIVKYNSSGLQQWKKFYDGTGQENDEAKSIAIDSTGNVYVTGKISSSGSGEDCATLKYNPAGELQWVKSYNGPANGNDYMNSLKVDESGNVYIIGSSTGIGTSLDYVTIKYTSAGIQQWLERYDGSANGSDVGTSLELDDLGNVLVTGYSTGNSLQDFSTLKYNNDGELQWIQTYSGPGNSSDFSNDLALDSLGNVYITGASYGIGSNWDLTTIKYSQVTFINPKPYDKWIAAETDTIKWIENGWASVNIKCVTNFETPIESEIILTQGFPIVSPEFGWEIPDTLLSYKSKIIVENANNPIEKIESDIFRIKPYVLTRVKEDSTYYEYRRNRDQWGFINTPEDIWPPTWYSQFDYQDIDPFTNNLQYSQSQGDSAFGKSKSHYHPDWVSWVNAFGTDACYFSTNNGFYKPTALLKWWAKSNKWGGSCFGIAGTNAMAFSHKDLFLAAFTDFPDFVNPIDVTSNNGTKKIVNQIFTHQYGNPSIANDGLSYNIKTPNQTINELKQILLEDNCEARSITIYNNSGGGAHTILAYGLEQDKNFNELYYIQVYDNSNPNSNIPIIVDTTQNGGNGIWNTTDWPGWGGNLNLYLELTADTYLNTASLTKISNVVSPFILQGGVVEINKPSHSSIKIIDDQGNFSGYFNNAIYSEIPGSIPKIIKNGSEYPPYGYSLPAQNYSVILSEFEQDTTLVFFFTSNKSFSYERNGVTQSQTDRLFFDGGVSAVNPDAETKTVKLLNLINETSQEKLCVVRSIELVQNDSIKIENPDSNKVKLISYGTDKYYDIELNYVTENGLGKFGDFNIPLSANTSHTFIPNWMVLTNSQLVVLVDIGNDGTIDDTLYLENTVGVEDQGFLFSLNSYNLSQNYPNPFNPNTKIKYQIPELSNVTLKVFDVLGNEIETLINEEKPAGTYELTWNATNLPSGVYFYQFKAGSFVETKKMILMK